MIEQEQMLRYVDWTKMLAIMAQDWSKERAIAKLELQYQYKNKESGKSVI